jgi:phosphosulfolactate phosphohydrolase-like enzyme
LVYCTTNGTVALLTSTAAQFTHIGSLLNAQALVAHIRRAQESVTAGHCG